VHHVAIVLQSDEWLAAWRQSTKRLLVMVPGAPRLNERIALRVRFQDQLAGATVVGTAVSVEHQHPASRIEMVPDPEGMRAVHLLCAAARGEAMRFVEREPRYLAKVAVFVEWRGERLLTNAISLSENGCALRWSGQAPPRGERIHLRIGGGPRAHEISAVVRWTDSGGGKLGLQIFALNGARKAWSDIVQETARAGAAVT
jgi:hypothetical protein